jgi:hypothetical protein
LAVEECFGIPAAEGLDGRLQQSIEANGHATVLQSKPSTFFTVNIVARKPGRTRERLRCSRTGSASKPLPGGSARSEPADPTRRLDTRLAGGRRVAGGSPAGRGPMSRPIVRGRCLRSRRARGCRSRAAARRTAPSTRQPL